MDELFTKDILYIAFNQTVKYDTYLLINISNDEIDSKVAIEIWCKLGKIHFSHIFC